MTREAMDELELLVTKKRFKLTPGEASALDVAIKALEQETCEDAISRQAALECLDWKYPDKLPKTKIMELPPVIPLSQEPKTGHWIDDEFGSKCSCCDIHTHLDKFDRPMKFKYCSMCGAKMAESEDEKWSKENVKTQSSM